MATTYRYRVCDTEFGPIGFRELVELVRSESLGAEDAVRPDWSRDWQPAGSVVGLFHMAGREDLRILWEQSQAAANSMRDEEAWPTETMSPNAESSQGDASWKVRMLDVVRMADAVVRANEQDRIAEELALRLDREKSRAIQEALEEGSDCHTVRGGNVLGRLWVLCGLPVGGISPRGLFRCGSALVAANLAVWGLMKWSAVELQRFPDAALLSTRGGMIPFWGPCGPFEYLFLLIDAFLLAGVLAYLLAGFLERMAED